MSRLSRADIRYFQKARQAAEISDYKRTHVGCVAVYQGNIIGIACNTNKTHPMQKYYNRYRYHPQTSYFYPKLHAEINCISSIRHLDINFSKVSYMYIGLVVIRNMELLAHVLVVWLQLRIWE